MFKIFVVEIQHFVCDRATPPNYSEMMVQRHCYAHVWYFHIIVAKFIGEIRTKQKIVNAREVHAKFYGPRCADHIHFSAIMYCHTH